MFSTESQTEQSARTGTSGVVAGRRTFRDGWRSAPWPLLAYAMFLLALGVFEVGLVLWKRYAWFDAPSLRWTLEMGYLTGATLVYFAIRDRRRRLLVGIVVVLLIQVLYAGGIYWLRPDAAPGTIAWTVVSTLVWVALLVTSPVRGFCSD